MNISLILTATTALFLAGCAADSPVAIEAERTAAPAPAQASRWAVDVGGTWNWTREEHLTMPEWIALAVFGIQPEGPITHVRCEVSGIIELVQTGDTFTGTELETASTCVSKGGQTFVPAAMAGMSWKAARVTIS